MDDDIDITKTVAIKPNQAQHDLDFPPTPEFIGAYKIESLLKRGGMSLIYLAIHPKTGRTVVLKVLLPKYLKNKDVLGRLLREAKILSMIDHPNIIKLYDLGQSDQGIYIAMEYVQGVSLRQFIKRETFTHRRALEIAIQIAYAIAHLHSQGIIHRDLKPDNVLFTESGEIKVIDFGISMFVEVTDKDHMTERKLRMGTPNYMSPEQRNEPEKVSFQTDIFALAIITYELYLGHMAHGVILTEVLPIGLQKTIRKALQLDPSKRHADIVDFIADLSGYLKHFDEEEKRATPEQMFQMLDESKNLLLSESVPNWPNIEIGIAIQGGDPRGSYLDFFPLAPNRFAVLFARPKEQGFNSLFFSSMLRGMIRMIATHQNEFHPVPQFLGTLNRALWEEKQPHPFDFSLLFLDIEHSLLAFGSSLPEGICHFRESTFPPRFLEARNPLLGAAPGSEFVEIKENWNVEDILILSSCKLEMGKLPHLGSQLVLDPKILAEKTARVAAPSNEESVLVAIKRL